MKKSYGFTLIEVIVVVAIVAVLVALAAPSFVQIIRSTNVASAVNGFLVDMRYARSESIKRGSSVVMCRSNSPEASSPTCGSGSGVDIDGDGIGDGWASGWIIFEDLNGDGTVDAGESILKVQARDSSIGSILEGGIGSSTKFRFTPTGRLRNLSGATTLTVGNPNYSSDLQRVLCVSMAGHVRIAGSGMQTCS
ncbi:MAG: GspH/FimT family protein [Rhodoferax sp.]|nr:GspH/FimT family protein [Rhodoferax sp.]